MSGGYLDADLCDLALTLAIVGCLLVMFICGVGTDVVWGELSEFITFKPFKLLRGINNGCAAFDATVISFDKNGLHFESNMDWETSTTKTRY